MPVRGGRRPQGASVRRAHSALTFLATSGVPDTLPAAWAGHANAAFIKRVYVTIDPEHLRVAATAFDRLLG